MTDPLTNADSEPQACRSSFAAAVAEFALCRRTEVLWNAIVLAATPIGGGHFFVDVIACAGIAFVTIYATLRLGNYLPRRQSQKQQPVLVPSHASARWPLLEPPDASVMQRATMRKIMAP